MKPFNETGVLPGRQDPLIDLVDNNSSGLATTSVNERRSGVNRPKTADRPE